MKTAMPISQKGFILEPIFKLHSVYIKMGELLSEAFPEPE